MNDPILYEAQHSPEIQPLYIHIGRGRVHFFRREDGSVWAIPFLQGNFIPKRAVLVERTLGLRDAKEMVEFLSGSWEGVPDHVQRLKALRDFSVDMVAVLRGAEEIAKLRNDLWKAKTIPAETQNMIIQGFLEDMQIWQWGNPDIPRLTYMAVYSAPAARPTLVKVFVAGGAIRYPIIDAEELTKFPTPGELEAGGYATRVY